SCAYTALDMAQTSAVRAAPLASLFIMFIEIPSSIEIGVKLPSPPSLDGPIARKSSVWVTVLLR
ncbi:hypothetical protein, partial [Phenylobacterium sp.]|uniref:hypothetical protein n=1 Tax=Phenylobacterium sp. TaxID=1871053 RepID=UPI00286CDD60